MLTKIRVGAALTVVGLLVTLGTVFSPSAFGIQASPTPNAFLKASQVGSSNPGFQTGDCPSEGFGYHFVLPGNDSEFVTIKVTFKSGLVVTDFQSVPTGKHAYVYTPGPDTILAAEATVTGSDTVFNLSHVCTGPDTTTTTTVPETTVPETTVPETTVPETTVPETTVPETTIPETTVPETTVPETTVPETTTSLEGTTIEQSTVPETTVPETTTSLEGTTIEQTTVPQTSVDNNSIDQTTTAPAVVPNNGVDQGTPSSPAPVAGAPAVSSGTLARTGTNSSTWAMVGISLILGGSVLMGWGNRRRLAGR